MAESNPPAEVRIHGQKVLGTFSTDADRGYCDDDRNRRFFLEPDNEVDFDYTKGFEEYVDMGDDPNVTSLTNVLCWMRNHRSLLTESGILDTKASRLNVDFVGRRGLLRNLLEAGGDKDLDIQLLVTLYRGTYFISGIWKNEEKLPRNQQMIAASAKLFRQFITSKDGYTPDTPAPVNDNASFYAMMSANCGRHRLLFSSEVQAERMDEITPPQRNYLNIRTIPNRQKKINPMKALRWWAANTISDISEIVCGIRDDKRRIVQTFQYIETNKLQTEYAQNKWRPKACIKTMESLLSQIKELVQDDDASTVYHLVLEPVEGSWGLEQRLSSRRFVSRGKRTDDFTFVEESLLHNILGIN
ncbi:decapping and exoribonuclease protein-like isoform X2 [Strongylocentrotus purpuratus]|uniref:Decapping nuclease n=1 Tax=Strongylocentrotus purpuratus TaxID=7668 RepID=A0A7M7T3H7_STRPU|nr:decapping and exoribonuclease protein-like isoform X2 [Strongylocentrotus purpuratus]